jgi:hypothetical protein
MITLTTQALRSDEDMKRAFDRFLMWGRKYLPSYFDWRVWVAQLQARGVLHFHLLLARRIPHALFLRMRALWCDTYGMGPGAVDIRAMRCGTAAAKYLARYVSGADTFARDITDDNGNTVTVQWPVSRHTGEVYVRDTFHGNPYGMSVTARLGTVPVTTFWAHMTAFPGLLNAIDHAACWFFDGPDEALAWLDGVLNGPGPPLPSVGAS